MAFRSLRQLLLRRRSSSSSSSSSSSTASLSQKPAEASTKPAAKLRKKKKKKKKKKPRRGHCGACYDPCSRYTHPPPPLPLPAPRLGPDGGSWCTCCFECVLMQGLEWDMQRLEAEEEEGGDG